MIKHYNTMTTRELINEVNILHPVSTGFNSPSAQLARELSNRLLSYSDEAKKIIGEMMEIKHNFDDLNNQL